MQQISRILLISTALALTACGQAGQQWFDPDKTFKLFDQPDVKGVNDTQEDMAKDAMKAGDYGRAAQFYQQMIATKKGTPEQMVRYKLGMAEATRRGGDNEAALAMYDEVMKDAPNNVDVMEGRGLALMATGKTVDAGRAFSSVIEKEPKRWRSLNALGILFVTKNMIPEAMAYYTEALASSPDNAAVLNNVGLSQATDRNFPRAIEALQQASRVSKVPSQKKQIELNLAMVYGVSGDMDNAREIASKYFEGPALDNNLGLYAHLAKDDNLARTYLNMALTQSPVYYERAWQNLDVVGDDARSDNTPVAPRAIAPAALPKPELLQQPSRAPQKKWHDMRTKKSSGKFSAAPVAETAEPAMLPEVTADQPAAPAPAPVAAPEKTTDKPAGLVVGPSE